MRPTLRLVAVLMLASLSTAACGSRLTTDQRTAALAQGGGSGSGSGAATGESTGGATGAGATGGAGSTGAGTATGTTGVVGPGSTGAGTVGGATGTTGGPGGGAGAGSATGGATDFTKAPAGGNGGATDVGVTATSITVANASDVSGAVPGLFEDARFATQAYFKYFAARYGTLYGRKINVLALDTQLDSGANRSASLQVCSDAFAGVGSVSAFDQGGASAIADCKVPDLRGLSTTDQMKAVPNAYPINSAGTGGKRSLAVFGWAAEKFPDAIKAAAYVYSDGDVTRQLAKQDIDGAQKVLKFNFVKEIAIGTSETNYAPAVSELKSAKITYVTFVGAYQQAANLAKEFARQNFKPTVYQPTVTAYAPNYIQQAGAASEGTYVAVSPSLLEEVNGNPELQLYAQWLQQVKPGAVPTAIGQFAWGAAALFVEQMIKVGPRPTRKALLARIPGIRNYSGNGLFPGQDVGGRELGDCTAIVQVKNGKFVRIEPLGVRALRCKDGVWNTKTQKLEEGFPPR